MDTEVTTNLPWVLCPTCGKLLGDVDMLDSFRQKVDDEHKTPGEAMDELGLSRECCRMRFWNQPVIPTCNTRTKFTGTETFVTSTNRNISDVPGVLQALHAGATDACPSTLNYTIRLPTTIMRTPVLTKQRERSD